jgi:cytidylate kinase
VQKKNSAGHLGYIVAIDGPSGAGKSTVSRKLAEALDGRLLDTGAMYRGVAFHSLKDNVTDETGIIHIANRLHFDMDPKTGAMLIDGDDLGPKLRTEKVSLLSSQISQNKEVRKILTRRQRSLARRWAKKIPVIVEGRDIGTVVFPKVRFKFFVTADAEVRAQRRYHQLKRQGARGVTLKSILKKNQQRDRQDSTRKVAPLKCPKDAVVVDTSNMAIPQVVQFMTNHIQARNFPEG